MLYMYASRKLYQLKNSFFKHRKYKMEFVQYHSDSSSLRDVAYAEGIGEVEEPTTEEVDEIIKKSKTGKAPGNDAVNARLIRYEWKRLHKKLMC